jgi:uncharacterized membrane protein HdeD (DUF308 family)
MTQPLRPDPADMLGRLGRHWGWALAFGIITVIAGVVVLAWPGPTLVVIAILFGVELVWLGVFRFVTAFGHDLTAPTRVLYALLGVLSLIIGLYSLRHVLITLLALALLLGIFWVVNGAVELFAALSHAEAPHRAWTIFMGILSIIAGIILLAYPGISLLVLYVIVAVWLLVFGFMQISIAWQIRSASHRHHGHEAHATT